MANLSENYIPLCEKSVRSDGTIGIKMIAPGWGSSGYYPADILERDAPAVFPPGTMMFWNHDTAMEEAERPEGDLSRLAAITTSLPRYEPNGIDGAGVYADARVMAGYAGIIDDIGGDIGLSIRAAGSFQEGEAEGRRGRIITELTRDPNVGSRVDFVTKPGAGGKIISVFESAPHAPKLPVNNFVYVYGNDSTNMPHSITTSTTYSDELDTFLSEAGRVLSRANETKLKAALEQLTAVLSTLGNEEVASESNHNLEANMSEQELKEAQAALAKNQEELTESKNALARLQEQLLLRESRDFVTAQLAEADLPEITNLRLVGQLARNPVVENGKIDEAKMKERIDAAITEAKAEIAAIMGSNGQITGMGESAQSSNSTIAESQKRIDDALAGIGYGG